MKTIKIIKYIFLLLVTQIVLFMVPTMINFSYGYSDSIFFTLNVVLSWYYIKQIEKLYYKKYDKLASMLYNVCPLIGISLLTGITYYFTKLDSVLFLVKYYIPLYIAIYLINLIYIIIKNINNK